MTNPPPPSAPPAAIVVISKENAVPLFELTSAAEAPFLVGTKGRNMSLIRHHTGYAIFIEGAAVTMAPQRAKPDAALARRMALSACSGGILRWFICPQATREGFPDHLVPTLRATALRHECDLELLRSRRGHMCLMLLPRLPLQPSDDADSAKEEEPLLRFCFDEFRTRIRAARDELLPALTGPPRTG